MAIKYGQKARECMIKELEKVFTDHKGFLFSNFDHVKAVDMTEFRKRVKSSGMQYFIVKKSLGKIALERAKISNLDKVFDTNKNIGVSIVDDDPVACAKLLKQFGKTNENFTIDAGYLEGRVLDKNKIKELADLPSRQELLSMVVGTMNAPIASFVGVLGAITRKFCYAINAIKEKKKMGS